MIDPGALATIGGAVALIAGLVCSTIGIATAASSGVATLAEDPRQFRNVLILASLPMTQSFYGLIVLIIILTQVVPNIPAEGSAGFIALGVSLIAAFAFGFSAVYQGIVCASGISMLPKTGGKILTSSMMLAVFVELIAVLALVFTIMAFTLVDLM